ncbi:MAG: RHS repeat-associated core domain-containing protein [Bacteroidia bacterium]|nr:RHS repeat-associated core domain-containing protein [Bacteroidia bacterium]
MAGENSLVASPGNAYLYNGKELQDELGLGWYDYGARMYAPDEGRWKGVDAMGEKYLSWSTYNYVMGNPVIYIDPDGNLVKWKDNLGNEITEDERKNVKVYIFYDSKPNGEDGGFPDQTMKQYSKYIEQYGEGSVAISDAKTESEFSADWGDIKGSPELILMNMHGTSQALHLDPDPDGDESTKDGEYLVSTDDGKTNRTKTPGTKISDLPNPDADLSQTMLCLNSCNSNNISAKMAPGTTLAVGFSKNTSVGIVRGSNKKVNFDSNGQPTTQWYYGGVWQYFRNGNQTTDPKMAKTHAKALNNFINNRRLP